MAIEPLQLFNSNVTGKSTQYEKPPLKFQEQHPAKLNITLLDSTFRHTLLEDSKKQIRLLRTRSGHDRDDHLAFKLVTVNLKDAPRFAAISYTWGLALPRCTVTVDRKLFEVTRNCRYALWQACAQKLSGVEYLWIDSICINQEDLHEKSSQVQLMQSIYNKAALVLICLGPHADNSELSVEVIKELRTRSGNRKDVYEILPHASRESWHFWTALRSFANREYWRRLWIIQEIFTASHLRVLCDDDILEWSHIEDIGQALTTFALREPHPATHLQRVSQGRQSYHNHPKTKARTLHSLLDEYFEWHCSDPRDRIYGLLSLTDSHKSGLPIIVDYGKAHLQLAVETLWYIVTEELANAVARGDPLDYFRQAQYILQSLDLNNSSAEMASLIEKSCRLSGDVFPSRRNILPPLRALPLDAADEYHGVRSTCSTLSIGPSGLANVSLGVEYSGRMRALADLESMPCRAFYGHFAQSSQTRIGWITSDVENGDVLLSIDFDDMSANGHRCLVLRHFHDSLYEIIGQALVDPSVSISLSACDNDCICQHHTESATKGCPLIFDLFFDPADLLLYSSFMMAESEAANQNNGLPWISVYTPQLARNFTRTRFSSYAVATSRTDKSSTVSARSSLLHFARSLRRSVSVRSALSVADRSSSHRISDPYQQT